uniref:Pentacotripeptide-repeat region of PRORP domain-containing protein n=2 Tax=Strongyloides stercoralis TaxID=6248 RepID=A0AAF5CSQ8_STRER
MIRCLTKKNIYVKNILNVQKCLIETKAIGIEKIESKTVSLPHKISKEDEKFVYVSKNFHKKVPGHITLTYETSRVPYFLSTKMLRHFRVYQLIESKFFIENFLLELENGNQEIINTLKCNEDIINILILLCGKRMTGTNSENRNIILDRLWNALEKYNFNLTIKSINTRLKVWKENGKSFDVKEMLSDLEVKRKLAPDQKFMNFMIHQLADCGMEDELNNFKDELIKRNLYSSKDYELAMIRCLSVKKMDLNCDNLIASFINKYGEDSKYEALSEAILGASQQANLPRIYSLLRRTIFSREDGLKTYYSFFLKNTDVMKMIWNLEMMSLPTNKNAARILIVDIFKHKFSKKKSFKLIIQECERHINEGNYYIGAVFIGYFLNLIKKMENKHYDNLVAYLLQKLLKEMVINCTDKEEMKSALNHLGYKFKNRASIFCDLEFFILTSKKYSCFEKLNMFLSFVDEIDPYRERYHLIYPIIAQETDIKNILSILFIWKNSGYNDLMKLNFHLIYLYVLKQMLLMLDDKYYYNNHYGRLEHIKQILISYDIPEYVIYDWMFRLKNYYKRKKDISGCDSLNLPLKDLTDWLKNNNEKKFIPITTVDMKKEEVDNQLTNCIKTKNLKNINSILNEKSTYQIVDVNSYTDKIIDVYLENDCRDEMITFITNISNYYTPLFGKSPLISMEQVLKVLQVIPKNIQNVNDILKIMDLFRKKFDVTDAKGEYFLADKSGRENLIFPLLDSLIKEGFTDKHIDDLQLLIINVFNFQGSKRNGKAEKDNDLVTPLFIHEILNHSNWDKAVEVFFKFQLNYRLHNGILVLLNHSLKNSSNLLQQVSLLSEFRKYTDEDKVNLYYIAALANSKSFNVTENEIQKITQSIKEKDAARIYSLIKHLPYLSETDKWQENFLNACLLCKNITDKKDILNYALTEEYI